MANPSVSDLWTPERWPERVHLLTDTLTDLHHCLAHTSLGPTVLRLDGEAVCERPCGLLKLKSGCLLMQLPLRPHI